MNSIANENCWGFFLCGFMYLIALDNFIIGSWSASVSLCLLSGFQIKLRIFPLHCTVSLGPIKRS